MIREYTCKQCGEHFSTGERGAIPEICLGCRPKVYKERHGSYYIPRKPRILDGWSAFRILRFDLLKRAQNKCSACGKQSTDLDIHHKDGNGFGKTKRPNNNASNLVVLCTSCHMQLHNNYALKLETIIHLRAEGQTFARIGQSFGVSRQRIHQIYQKIKRP